MALTSDESAALMNNMDFRGRVKVSALKYADSIFNELPTVPAHNTRYNWAKQTFQNPEATAIQVQPPTVMDAAVQNSAIDPETGDSDITDAALQGSVEAVVNKML